MGSLSASEAYVQALKSAKITFITTTLPSLLKDNIGKFWRLINPAHDSFIALENLNGDNVPSNLCATTLNDVFVQNFCPVSNVQLPNLYHVDFSFMYPVFVDVSGVAKLIDSLKKSASPGYDCICTKFLKSTSAYSSIILTKIFQQSLDTSSLPTDWKIGKVVPLHKSGSKTSPLNYRPISLTSTCCKLLEHVIFKSLVSFLEDNAFFSSSQHGFRKTYSCETQLLSFTHKLHHILDESSFADCIFMDFSKAFDKVCHQLLLHKLSFLNLDPNLFKWIESFLLNRLQFVSANGHNSSFTDVHSGVPQGSVLGPLLFLIYINDLPSVVSSDIFLFADDCVIFREINTDRDINILQSDIVAISNWCKTWRMELNIKKCKVMRVARNTNTPPIYLLNSVPLESVSSYKYLGVHISCNLNWTVHTEYIINNANRMLGYLRRNFSTVPSSVKLILYKTLIRPKLEYAASVWDPMHVKLITALELVQNNSTRFILSNYNRTASITAMKASLSLPSLAARRRFSRLNLFHNIYYHTFLHDILILSPQYISHRIDHRYKVGIPFCKTKTFSESFLPRTAIEWNHLPADIVSIIDNQRFREALTTIT